MQLSMFSSAELPANPSQSRDYERAWMIRVATSPSRISQFWIDTAPPGAVGRTSPASCHQAADGTLEPFSEGWGNSGMGGPTESWTLQVSEFPSVVVESSLSDILEPPGSVPQRCYLSPKACSGFLRRLTRGSSQMSDGGLERVDYLIRSMRNTAKSGAATNGTPGGMSLSPTADPDAPPF